jgi:hypothetical protein
MWKRLNYEGVAGPIWRVRDAQLCLTHYKAWKIDALGLKDRPGGCAFV